MSSILYIAIVGAAFTLAGSSRALSDLACRPSRSGCSAWSCRLSKRLLSWSNPRWSRISGSLPSARVPAPARAASEHARKHLHRHCHRLIPLWHRAGSRGEALARTGAARLRRVRPAGAAPARSGTGRTGALPIVGALTGLLATFTGVFVLPNVPYLQALGLDRDDLIQALGLSFTVSTVALGVGLAANGALPTATVGASVLTLAPALIGMSSGQIVATGSARLSPSLFLHRHGAARGRTGPARLRLQLARDARTGIAERVQTIRRRDRKPEQHRPAMSRRPCDASAPHARSRPRMRQRQ